MPEPQKEPVADFPNRYPAKSGDLARSLCRKIVESRIDREGRQGRLIMVESRSLRRNLRRYSSARESLTHADVLFVAISYLPSDFVSMIPAGANRPNPLHLSRLERTLGHPEEAQRWAIMHAAKLLAIVDDAARSCGGSCDWVLEGVDWPRIAEILAVPADHRICGLIAVSGAGFRLDEEILAELRSLPIDLDGFGGGFEAGEPDTGVAPDRAL